MAQLTHTTHMPFRSTLSPASLRLRALFAASAAGLVLGFAATAQGDPSVTKVEILIFREVYAGVEKGWYIQTEITGTEFGAAADDVTVTPPGKDPINIPGDANERKIETDFYTSLAALRVDFPPSTATKKYVYKINDVITLSLDFDPTIPDGAGTILSPTHDSGTTDTSPTITVASSGCTNCNVQVVGVFNRHGGDFDLELFEFGPPFSTSIEISDLQDGDGGDPITDLPIGTYELCQSLANGVIEEDFANGGQVFELTRAAVGEECLDFHVVPVPDVVEIEMEYLEKRVAGVREGWYMATYVLGNELVEANLTPPVGGSRDLPVAEDGEMGRKFGPFDTLEDLQDVFPPSGADGYVISLNRGVAEVEIDFDPVIPDRRMSVTSPANGAVVGDPTPEFTVSTACTNCEGQYAEIFDAASDGDWIQIEATYDAPFPSAIPYADFGENSGNGGSVAEGLPESDYSFVAEAFNEVISTESMTPPDEFELYAGAFRDDRIAFAVPEPASSALAAAALLTLGALVGGRRRS